MNTPAAALIVGLALLLLAVAVDLPRKLHCGDVVEVTTNVQGRVIAPEVRCEGRMVQATNAPLWRCECGGDR